MFNKYAFIPNQNEEFKQPKDLYTDNIKDGDLIYILELLDDNWKNILLHDSISFGNYNNKYKKDIASKITEKLKKGVQNKEQAIFLLCAWFDNYPQQGKDLFAEMYKDQAKLFMDTISDKESLHKIMRTCKDLAKLAEISIAIENNPNIFESIQKAQDIDKLLEEFNVRDISDLKKILISSQSNLVNESKKQITQETLLSLGITSIEELEKALKNKEFSDQFIHESTNTVDMFLHVQRLIKRSKENVLKHLKTLPNYECCEAEELENTIIRGVKKDGISESIYIVVRPSDNGEVILYYDSEKDKLEFPTTELWIDNGRDKPENLTLGKIIKKTGINRIPIT